MMIASTKITKNYFHFLLHSVFAAALMMSFGLQKADAFSVSPIVNEMTTTGKKSRATIRVINTGKKPLPVELQIKSFTLKENGNRVDSKAADNLLIFPPQAMIRPGATQNFRVQWVGDPDIKKSQHYMMKVTQLPVKMKKKQSAVQVVLSFGVMLNIAPLSGTSDLKLVKTGVTKDKKGKWHPTITVANPTSVHALLPFSTINLSGGSWSKTLHSQELRAKVGVGLVPAQGKRRFVLPVDLPKGVKSVKANLVYKPKK